MEEYIKFIGKSDSCYTVYWINYHIDDVINELEDRLKNLNKKIKDTYKRKQANDIIFNFKTYLETLQDEKINHIFLFNQDIIKMFLLSKDQIKIAKEWGLPTSYLTYSDHFKVSYLKNVFGEEKIYQILKLDNKKGTFYQITENKQRKIWEKDFTHKDELIETSFDLICGVSSKIKEFNNSINKNLTKDEILEIIKEREMVLNHTELEKIISNLTNPEWENKLVFGKKDISKSLQYCEIKTLFLTSKNLNKIKKNININFETIIIDKLKIGDIGDTFKRDYDGLLGIKYF